MVFMKETESEIGGLLEPAKRERVQDEQCKNELTSRWWNLAIEDNWRWQFNKISKPCIIKTYKSVNRIISKDTFTKYMFIDNFGF